MKNIILILSLLIIGYQSFAQKRTQQPVPTNFNIYNHKGKLKRTIQYDLVKRGSNDFLIVSNRGKFGIYNYKKGKITTELKYRDISAVYINGLAAAKDKNDKLGLIHAGKTKDEKIVLPFEYYKVFYLNDRYFSVTKLDRKWGVFDVVEKRFVIECQFDTRITLQDDVFIVRDKNQYGLYGKDGKIVMPFQKQKFHLEPNIHLINIHRNNSTLLFNTKTLEYQSDMEFTEFPIQFFGDYAAIQKDGKFGFLHSSGKMITGFEYDEVGLMNKFGFAKVRKGNRWGVINNKGKMVITLQHSKKNCPDLYKNGLYLERVSEELEGVRRMDGTWLIQPEYYFFMMKDNYITAQKKDNSFFLFDLNGSLIKSTSPNKTIEPVGSLYRLYDNKKFGWADAKFNTKGEIGSGFLNDFETDNFATVYIKETNKYGAVNAKGKLIIPIEYQYIWNFEIDYKIVFVKTPDEKWGAYNLKGKQIIEPQYRKKINLAKGWSVLVN